MKTTMAPLDGDDDGHRQNAGDETMKKNLGEAVGPTSPTNCNDTGEGNVTARDDDSPAGSDVTPEARRETPPDEAVSQAGNRAAASADNPASVDDGDNVEEITAEDIMVRHAEETPSEDDGFSLDEVVATEQVVPANLARAAGVNFRKPNDKEFIRVTQNPQEIMPFDILEVDEKTNYIVTPTAMAAINKLHEEMGQVMIKTKRKLVHLTVNMDGEGFLWPITVWDGNNTWLESAHKCALIARDQWIRLVSNQPAKRYDYHPANKHAGTVPKWPKETFLKMLNLAFKNKVIKSLDHPAIKQLLDEE